MTKQKTPADYAALLRTGRWFAALPVAFAEALVGAARLVALAPGETLFSRGDPPTGIFACLDGAAGPQRFGAGGQHHNRIQQTGVIDHQHTRRPARHILQSAHREWRSGQPQ